MVVLRRVTVRMRNQDGLTEREEDGRPGGSVWMPKQVTVRMKGQDGLTEREEDERSGFSVYKTVRQKGRGTEGHMWVMSVTREQGEGD
jgi:hypothetical protein